MSDVHKAAEKLLKAIDGVHLAAQVMPGVTIQTRDVIKVCRELERLQKLIHDAREFIVCDAEDARNVLSDEDAPKHIAAQARRLLDVLERIDSGDKATKGKK